MVGKCALLMDIALINLTIKTRIKQNMAVNVFFLLHNEKLLSENKWHFSWVNYFLYVFVQ